MPRPNGEVRMVIVDGLPYEKMADGTLVPMEDLTDYARLDAMTDEEITAAAESDPDARPMTDEEWARGELLLARATKAPVTLRIDPDVLAWFKSAGAGYQTRMNAVLRRYMEAQTAAKG